MAIVTGISWTKNVARVYADGRALCSIDKVTFAAFPINEGDALDPQAYLDRVAAAQSARAYACALDMLSASARTALGIERALLRKGFVSLAVEATLARLEENKLIDDQAFARRMVELSADRPVGRYALRRKLQARGVSPEDADDALAALRDEDQKSAAVEIAQKLARRYEGQDRRAARAKLGQALARRGFSWDDVSAALDALSMGDEDT